MKEAKRRDLDRVSRRLKSCETALNTARANFAEVVYDLIENEKCSLGDVSKTMTELGRPMSRQRVHQIVSEMR